MPSYSTKMGHERLERFEDSWETNASAETEFGDVTLVEFKSVITASNAKKDEIALAEQKVKTLKIEHKNIINDGMEKCDYIVRAVEGDRRFGPDSALYGGFGYIRESEKKKGGRRKVTPEQ
jgi:hypothetical protein